MKKGTNFSFPIYHYIDLLVMHSRHSRVFLLTNVRTELVSGTKLITLLIKNTFAQEENIVYILLDCFRTEFLQNYK